MVTHGAHTVCLCTGSPSSKYEHRGASALLRNIQNIGICMGKKHYRFRNLRKWKDFNKKQLTLLKMCYVSPVWSTGRFMAVLWVLFLYREKTVYIKTHKTARKLACSRLRDSGESEKSLTNKKTRGGTAPFPKSRAFYFPFARLIRPHYTIWEPGTG